MRTVIASLILATGLGGSVLAQDAMPPAPPSAAPPAPVAAEAPAGPSGPATAPVAAAVERPTLPTEGYGAAVLSVLMRACIPMVQQTKTLEEAAEEMNMRRNRRTGVYEAQLGERPYTIGIRPQGANTNVCAVEINYPIGGEEPIVEALNIWAFLQEPELELQRNDFLVGPDNIKRTTLAWEHFTDSESTGLVFVQLKNPDDSPLERNYDKATLLYSERTF